MEDSKGVPELVNNTHSVAPSQSEIESSGTEASEKAIRQSDKTISETPDSNREDEDVYPGFVTKVFVGIGLALAVFLVFTPHILELIWAGWA